MLRTLIFSVFVLSAAVHAGAAEIVLREQAAPRGPVVRLGDVADLKADAGKPLDGLANTPLMPAPAPGTQQFLRSAELRDLLAARGADVEGFRITGAPVVTISESSPAATPAKEAPAPPANVEVQTAADSLEAAIVNYLRLQTGHDLWNVQVDADDDVIAAFQQPDSRAVVSGGKAPWSGRQRFNISGGPGSKPAIAYARIERLEMAAFATRAIERGDLIRRSDIELRPHVGALPAQAVVALESIVGKEAVQGIRPDALLLNNHVRSPIVVRRGERVTVRARAAGVVVRTYAVAQQDGSLGELVMVQALAGKDRYAARVSGPRELEVFAAGSAATDIAAASQPVVR
jgi:flagella basal body P-ring formation protein FlgA